MEQLLTYNPAKRITAHAALSHEYFKDLKKEDINKYSHPI